MSNKTKRIWIAFPVSLLIVLGVYLFVDFNPTRSPNPVKNLWWMERGFDDSIDNVQMLPHFIEATNGKNAVLFLDAACNAWTVRHRDFYRDFSGWLVRQYNQPPLFVDVSVAHEFQPSDGRHYCVQRSLFAKVQLLTNKYHGMFGYKTYFGAGSIAWLKNGVVVDLDFAANFKSADEIIQKTKTIFSSGKQVTTD